MWIIHTSLYSQEDSLNDDDAVNALPSETHRLSMKLYELGAKEESQH